MSVIEIKNLTRDYGGKGVFDLTLSVESGETFGFLGPNGAGKTTAIRHLTGFLKPQKGSCAVNGLDCWAESPKIHGSLGYLPGEIAFFDDMTGLDFLNFIAEYRRVKDKTRMRSLLERFELDARGKIKKMSKGMKQKVGITAAFMHDPAALILDEPTSGLDPLMQSRFIELILEENKRGKTILMSSHMFEEVERTCRRVAIIKNGRLATVDSIDKLKAAQVKKYVITLENEKAALAFAKEFAEEDVSETRVTVSIAGNIRELISQMNKYPVAGISMPGQSLEEIFMQYYGGNKNV
ncbi:MAG: ABC transporter ATP-binding protein [Clostridiales bacterium]|jgi:ABC-2 type transport system ATP-binding protein|nr:ABC transporter ATP-binding protein [Clostridiales bacterium]